MDFRYAKKLGASIKLFGTSRMEGEAVHAWVAPVMVGKNHPLYGVGGAYNGILVKSDKLGTSMYYGSGAGKLPTASAVVADLIEAAQNEGKNVPIGWNGQRLALAGMDTFDCRYFVRVAGDAAGKKGQVEDMLGKGETIVLEGADEFAVVTPQMSEREFKERAIKLEQACRNLNEEGIRQMIRTEL